MRAESTDVEGIEIVLDCHGRQQDWLRTESPSDYQYLTASSPFLHTFRRFLESGSRRCLLDHTNQHIPEAISPPTNGDLSERLSPSVALSCVVMAITIVLG